MKYLGTILMMAGIAAFIAPRLNLDLPDGLTLPTLPTDAVGGIFLVAGVARKVLDDHNR
jgi:hypothetical protein